MNIKNKSNQITLVDMFSPTVRSNIQSITFSQNCIIIQKKTKEDFQYSDGRYNNEFFIS
jgi:hypothetical protein